MSSVASPRPEQGLIVDVRRRRWIVNDIAKSSLPAHFPHLLRLTPHRVTLSSIETEEAAALPIRER